MDKTIQELKSGAYTVLGNKGLVGLPETAGESGILIKWNVGYWTAIYQDYLGNVFFYNPWSNLLPETWYKVFNIAKLDLYKAGEIIHKGKSIGWCEQKGKVVVFNIHLELGEQYSGNTWHNNILKVQGVDMPSVPVYFSATVLDLAINPSGVTRVQMSVTGTIDVLANVSFSGLVVTGTYLVR